jgi:hypothetical protein
LEKILASVAFACNGDTGKAAMPQPEEMVLEQQILRTDDAYFFVQN